MKTTSYIYLLILFLSLPNQVYSQDDLFGGGTFGSNSKSSMRSSSSVSTNKSTKSSNSNYNTTSSKSIVDQKNVSSATEEPMYIDCSYCNGTGKYMCNLCAGQGWRLQSTFVMYVGYVTNKITCELCKGTGKSNTCIYCNSTGKRVNPNHPYARGGSAGISYSSSGSSSFSSSRSSKSSSRSLCSACGGTGVDRNPWYGNNPSTSSWIAYTNNSDNVCPHCNRTVFHTHNKCASCNVPRY